ncbi:MAG: c-type cytochrome [Hyphomicrobiaceae bacterium]|nr:c-type cytochrome [Hyphomicrobiaceae bacterium]
MRWATAAVALALGLGAPMANAMSPWVPLPAQKNDVLNPRPHDADPARGAQLFKGCAACHDVGRAGHHVVGPSLAGIVDRPAAAFPDYAYSEALATAGREGLVWTADFLSDYIRKPHGMLPGTKKAYVGVDDAADRRHLIAFLASLPAPAAAAWIEAEAGPEPPQPVERPKPAN